MGSCISKFRFHDDEVTDLIGKTCEHLSCCWLSSCLLPLVMLRQKHSEAKLCAGGADAVDSLQWQTVAEARAKDKLELQQCSASKSNKDAVVTKSARSKPYSDNTCHTGPRGGRYLIVNGHKRYGC